MSENKKVYSRLNEILGLSPKEKYVKYIKSQFDIAIKELKKYNYDRLVTSVPKIQAIPNAEYRTAISKSLYDFQDSCPTAYKIFPSYFQMPSNGTNATACLYYSRSNNDYDPAIIPAQFHKSLKNIHVDTDYMKTKIIEHFEYRKKELISESFISEKENIRTILELLKNGLIDLRNPTHSKYATELYLKKP